MPGGDGVGYGAGVRRLLAALLLIVAVGCAEGGGPAGPLRVATGGRGGVYHAYGHGIADAVRAELRRLEPEVLSTAASVENLRMIADGDADVAFALADSAALAIAGDPPFHRPRPIRALARLYHNYVQLVVPAGSPIRSLADLRGRVVSTGAIGSGTELIAGRLLSIAGVHPDRDLRRRRLDIAESVRALRLGTVDAFFWSGGLPTAAITELGRGQVDMVDLSDYVAPMRARYGEFYSEHSIPASAYGLSSEVQTIGVPNYLVVNAAMDEQLAYELTRLLFDHRDQLTRAHPEARRLNRRAAIGTGPVRLHPGAQRYYRETKL